MDTKKCNKCEETKPLDGFSKDKGIKCGLRSSCKICDRHRCKQYHQANKEALNEKCRQYHQANREKINKRSLKYNQTNRDKIKEYQKQYQQANKELIAEKQKQYQQANKEELAKKQKRYQKKNRGNINAYKRERYATDLAYKVECRLRSRLYGALGNTSRVDSTRELVGCTPEQLVFHLEEQFTDGMTWNGIHIDHIRPCASFDLTDPEQQRECFHYTNLQPLWAKDNLRKADKWETPKQP